MPLEQLISRQITGIQPFNELPIDAEIWREAHAQHALHRRLHALSVHRPGIVYGLDVFVDSKAKKPSVVVTPGVGVDPEGEVVILNAPVQFDLEWEGNSYISILYENLLDGKSVVRIGGQDKQYRLIESRQVVRTKELPQTPHLELARIDRSSATAAVREPQNPFDPDEDELNLLFRTLAFPHCYADGAAGELCFLPKGDAAAWKPNRAGLISLLRVANGAGFHVDYTGLYNLKAPKGRTPFLLYVSTAGDFQALTDDQTKGLASYIEKGGTLLADASGGDAAFFDAAKQLLSGLGFKLEKPKTGSSILTAHNIFAAPPKGARDGELLVDEKRGVLLSSADYGAAWSGRVSGADSRDRIREAQEFGFNILAYAARRNREAAWKKG